MSNKKLINEVKLVEVGQKILLLDDDRVNKYKNGEISQTEFLLLLKKDDPFYIINGMLTLITNYDISSITKQRLEVVRELYIDQGNIDCVKLYENKELLLSIYPELKKIIKEVSKDLKFNSKCGLTRRTNIILIELLKIKYDGRDISALKDIVGELGMLRLTNQKIEIDEAELLNNDIVYKRFCK